jgi:hypothetical protein
MASFSSLPPHIQPPIAQVPSAMRDTESEVFGILTNSIATSGVSICFMLDPCYGKFVRLGWLPNLVMKHEHAGSGMRLKTDS